jgi:hypothetical protein
VMSVTPKGDAHWIRPLLVRQARDTATC